MAVIKPGAGRPCEVVFYSGYKGRETPRAVRVKGREIPVERILGRRRIRDASSGEPFEEFPCRLDEPLAPLADERLEDRTVKIFVSDRGGSPSIRKQPRRAGGRSAGAAWPGGEGK